MTDWDGDIATNTSASSRWQAPVVLLECKRNLPFTLFFHPALTAYLNFADDDLGLLTISFVLGTIGFGDAAV